MINLLVVDDDNITRSVIERCAKKWGYRVYSAKNGQEGRGILEKKNINIAILDWELPDTNGIQLSKEIRSASREEYIYVIILTSRSDRDSILRGFEAGTDDYISKPFNVFELKARITTGARIIKLQNRLKRSQKKLREIASHDELTGLLNRRAILEVVQNEYNRSSRTGEPLGFISIDIDHFKLINDTYGHPVGDKVLKQVTSILNNSLRTYDKFGRTGGEEFLAVLPDCAKERIEKIAERLKKNIESSSFILGKIDIPVTISLGLTVYEKTEHVNIELILQGIDTALYKAKNKGRNCWIYIDILSEQNLTGGFHEKRTRNVSGQLN